MGNGGVGRGIYLEMVVKEEEEVVVAVVANWESC
jgi:hypothetical protein